MDDVEQLARSYAARLLAYDDPHVAAEEMFKIVEQVILDDDEYDRTKTFILQVVKVMDEIDSEYNYKVAKIYYKMAKEIYGD